MSYNGNGTFVINSAGQPVSAGQVISSSVFNALTADLATGLTTALTKDGQTTPTANIPLGGFKLTGLGVPTASGDALSYGAVGTITTLTLTNALGISYGGTGQTTAALAINALLPTQTSNAGKVLTTDGSVCSWSATGTPGTVTSVAISGGSTGLTTSGGPITASGTITLAGTLAVGYGGTGLTAGTSGGIPYYSSSSAMTSSGALTASALVLGGGAGAAPTPMASLGTTTTVLHGNAGGAPTFGAVSLTTDVSGTLPAGSGGTGITSLASGIATWLGTSSSANLATAMTDETGSGSLVFATSPSLTTPLLGTPTSGDLSNCTGYPLTVPQNSQSANYTTVLGDANKHIFHPSTDTNARTFTIAANASVAYVVGTTLSFVNMTANVVTIAINSDTLYLAGTGTTGSRSLARYGLATAIKMTSTTWLISGTGLT